PAMSLPAGPGGAIGWAMMGTVMRIGFGGIAVPLAMTAAALVAWLLLATIGLSPGDWREIGSGAGRHAGRLARASGRGTVAAASFGHRLFQDWREARRAFREADPDFAERPPRRPAEFPPRTAPGFPPRQRSVVTPLPERREARLGPVVTLYELEPAPGIKASRVIGLADDIARSMSAISVRVAVVPGRTVIGIELPNLKAETVYLRELLDSPAYEKHAGRLALALGKDIGGEPVIADLARMPHLLIAGTTGSGKSVGINTMILSILYRMPPDRCKFIMVDP